MKFEAFQSGKLCQQYQYKSFHPAPINQEWSWDDTRIGTLLERASKALGELNAFTMIVPEVDLYLQMHVLKEANLSSRIEGTCTEMDEAVLDEEEVLPERRNDWREVQNYVRAMNEAIPKEPYLSVPALSGYFPGRKMNMEFLIVISCCKKIIWKPLW